LFALWREGDLMQIESSDTYIMELKDAKRDEAYWVERADAE
jgi:hypothetical protein